jgi:multiple sugar transport system substrate-binding protein
MRNLIPRSLRSWWAAITLAGLAAVLGAAPTAANAVDIEFWTVLTTASQTQVIQKHTNQCAEGMKGVNVKFSAVTLDGQYTRLLTAIQGGTLPNVMNATEGVVAFLNARGALSPATGIVKGLGRDDFRPSSLAAISKSGEVWAVPDWALHQEVWYRKDLFAKAGLQPPKSWSELLAAAKKLTVDTDGDGTIDQYGFAVPMARVQVAPQTFFQIFYSAGGTLIDPKTGQYVFGEQKKTAVEAMQFMMDLYKAASPPASVEWSFNDFRTSYVKGQVAMTNEWGAVVGIAQEQNPGMLENMSVFRFPGPRADKKPAASLGGGYYYLVTKASAEKVAASEALVKCMFTPERVAERANSRPIFAIPATKSAFNHPVYTSNPMVKRFRPELETIFHDVMDTWYRYGSEAGLNLVTGQIEATAFVGTAIQNAALGKITAAEAVDSMDAEFRKLFIGLRYLDPLATLAPQPPKSPAAKPTPPR